MTQNLGCFNWIRNKSNSTIENNRQKDSTIFQTSTLIKHSNYHFFFHLTLLQIVLHTESIMKTTHGGTLFLKRVNIDQEWLTESYTAAIIIARATTFLLRLHLEMKLERNACAASMLHIRKLRCFRPTWPGWNHLTKWFQIALAVW